MRFKLLADFDKWLLVILTLAAVLRFAYLGEVPHGMTWDEAAIGYNGYAIMVARRDEWLQKLPVSFKSFGDFKAPLAMYMTGPFTLLLGSKLWVLRLPFAIGGVLGVAVAYWLIWELLLWAQVKTQRRIWLARIGALILATSPWHLHFSRAGFESSITLGLVMAALASGLWLLRLLEEKQKLSWQIVAGTMLALSTAATFYMYHSSKIVMPIVSLALVVLVWSRIKKSWRSLWWPLAIAAAILIPFAKDSILGEGATRFKQATVFGLEIGSGEKLQLIVAQFFAHLTPNFLVLGQITSLRHGDGVWGVLLPTTFISFLLGVVSIAFLRRAREKAIWLFGIVWFLAGLLPAAIGREAPHGNRALLALPGVIIVVVIGLNWFWTRLAESKLNKRFKGSHGEKNIVVKSVLGTFLLFHFLFSLAYLHHYYTKFAAESAGDFKDGYLEAFEYVVPFERGWPGYNQVDQVIFTNHYEQAYIYALYVRRTNPIWYQGGSLNTYLFTEPKVSDLARENAILVASPESELPTDQADKVIYGSNGEPRFYIYHTYDR